MLDIAAFIQLDQIVARMREAAEAGDWDHFIELQQNYLQVSASLPKIESLDPQEIGQQQLPDMLQRVQANLNVMLPLAEAWREKLAAELAGTQNAAKLNRIYQP